MTILYNIDPMKMTPDSLRKSYIDFFVNNGHLKVTPAPLVPTNDPTTLFTSSGMQQLIPYLSGQATHPLGKKLVNSQLCLRVQDIDEVGDNRHSTAFEMLGNWSIGDYFKEEQLNMMWEFYHQQLGLDKSKLHVTVFGGDEMVGKDEESLSIWKKLGVSDDHIHTYDVRKNWWSRSGIPKNMPIGEIGGPDSEIFFDFGTPHDISFGENCHPNCDCGRFMEIGNSVFIQYIKNEKGEMSLLQQSNVDFGGGLERILTAMTGDPDMFKTDFYWPCIEWLAIDSKKSYDSEFQQHFRIIADHMKAVYFLLSENVYFSNKAQGYVLRKLYRRALLEGRKLYGKYSDFEMSKKLMKLYAKIYLSIISNEISEKSIEGLKLEWQKFGKVLDLGERQIKKISGNISAEVAFDLFQSQGLPLEVIVEISKEEGKDVDIDGFTQLLKSHQNISKAGATKLFKGGLADSSEQVVKYHTATHLLHQALFEVCGDSVSQQGSNITGDRLRFDFFCENPISVVEKNHVEEIINTKTKESLDVYNVNMSFDEAIKNGAKAFFKEKYPSIVSVYLIGSADIKNAYSKELCGGPHVKNTSEIGKIEIYKLEKIGNNIYRVYAK